jgi:plasmid stability protein
MAVLNIKDFPADLLELLRQRARAKRRSIAQEVIFLLERALRRKKHSILSLKGLGKEIWAERDAVEYVKEERDG